MTDDVLIEIKLRLVKSHSLGMRKELSLGANNWTLRRPREWEV